MNPIFALGMGALLLGPSGGLSAAAVTEAAQVSPRSVVAVVQPARLQPDMLLSQLPLMSMPGASQMPGAQEPAAQETAQKSAQKSAPAMAPHMASGREPNMAPRLSQLSSPSDQTAVARHSRARANDADVATIDDPFAH
jgi:hypothetical protein